MSDFSDSIAESYPGWEDMSAAARMELMNSLEGINNSDLINMEGTWQDISYPAAYLGNEVLEGFSADMNGVSAGQVLPNGGIDDIYGGSGGTRDLDTGHDKTTDSKSLLNILKTGDKDTDSFLMKMLLSAGGATAAGLLAGSRQDKATAAAKDAQAARDAREDAAIAKADALAREKFEYQKERDKMEMQIAQIRAAAGGGGSAAPAPKTLTASAGTRRYLGGPNAYTGLLKA